MNRRVFCLFVPGMLAVLFVENPRSLAIEDVLLNLPNEFMVACTGAHFQPIEGLGDGNRQKLDWIDNDHPLIFRFHGDRFTAELKGGKTDEPAPGTRLQSQWAITVMGKFENGVMRGHYRSYQTLADLSDPEWKGGYMCSKTRIEGTFTGQADAEGKVKITVSDLTPEAMERPYKTDRSPDGKTARIKPLGGWDYASEQAAGVSLNDLLMEIRLPVGRLKEEQKGTAPPARK